jgi:hypothetical protein
MRFAMQVSTPSSKTKKPAMPNTQGWVVDDLSASAATFSESAARAARDAFQAKYPLRTLRKGEKSPLALLKAARDSR